MTATPKYNPGRLPKLIVSVTRTLLLFLFTYTLVNKLADLPLYTITMKSQPFPAPVSEFLIWTVPGAEGAITLLLLSDKTVRSGLWLAVPVLGLFTGYAGLIVCGFYRKVPCPCGGIISGLDWREHLGLNLFFLILTIVSIKLSQHTDAIKMLRNQEKPNTCINQ